MKVKLYNIISDAIEKGIERGYRQAHKHTDTPDETYIKDRIHSEILNELCEYLDFEDETIETT